MNILRPGGDGGEQSPSGVATSVPRYTLEEASGVAKALINESTSSGWTQVSVNYEGIESCWSKLIATNINNDKIFCNKATSFIDAAPDKIFAVYWNGRLEMEWNSTTVQKMTLLEDLGSVQLVHQELKKNALVNIQNDVVIRRAYDKLPNGGIWVFAVSEDGPAVKPPFTRGQVPFGGFLIEPAGNNRCKVTLLWSFDYNKQLHVKYVDEEPKRTALRLCRIKKKIDEDEVVAQRSAAYAREKASAQSTHN